MKKVYFIMLGAMVLLICGCGAAKDQLMGIYNISNCKYSYQSLGGVSVDGINSSNALSLENAKKLSSILLGDVKSVPVDFIVNMNVQNPNSTPALFSGFDYTLSVDNIKFVNGSMQESFEVLANSSRILSIPVQLDAKSLISDSSTKDAFINIVKNLLGISTKQSDISVSLLPTYMVGNKQMSSPIPVNVNFILGK